MRAVLARGAALFGLWIVLSGVDPIGSLVGLATAGAATFASLQLLPPTGLRLRPLALAGLTARLARQSVAAGLDVAVRAFDPELPLRPSPVRYAARLQQGILRQAFAAMSSLVPGALPAGTDGEGVSASRGRVARSAAVSASRQACVPGPRSD